MTLTPADRAIIAAARRRAGVPDGARATPAQAWQILGMLPTRTAEALIADWYDAAAQALRRVGPERRLALARKRPLSAAVPNRGRRMPARP